MITGQQRLPKLLVEMIPGKSKQGSSELDVKANQGADMQALNAHLLKTAIEGLDGMTVKTDEGVVRSGIGEHIGAPGNDQADLVSASRRAS